MWVYYITCMIVKGVSSQYYYKSAGNDVVGDMPSDTGALSIFGGKTQGSYETILVSDRKHTIYLRRYSNNSGSYSMYTTNSFSLACPSNGKLDLISRLSI